jgi:hypothetical protein
MKKLRWLIAIAGFAAACSPGCATLSPVATNVLSAVIDCSVPKVREVAIDLIPTVESIVAKRGDGWEDDLTELGRKHLEDALACAIREVGRSAFHAAQAAPSDTLSDVKARRSMSYMEARGYKFADGGGP